MNKPARHTLAATERGRREGGEREERGSEIIRRPDL
jgi:hypothetical protein